MEIKKFLTQLQNSIEQKSVMAWYENDAKTYADCWQDILNVRRFLLEQKQSTWALWSDDSYNFVVLFFGLLLSKKNIVLPPSRLLNLEQQFAAEGIYFIDEKILTKQQHNSDVFSVKDLDRDWISENSEITFFTSGSTGQPKKIIRSFNKLMVETFELVNISPITTDTVVLSTASHQHIYGFQFKIMQALAQGASFWSFQKKFPDKIVNISNTLNAKEFKTYLVTSPALLKRWPQGLSGKSFTKIFSAGGILHSEIINKIDNNIIDILGATETGFLSYKETVEHAWTLCPSVEFRIEPESTALWIKTVRAYTTDWIKIGDSASMDGESFKLGPRLDRIVKLEEKRLSLDAIEQSIIQQTSVVDCYAILTVQHENRDAIGVVCVLSDADFKRLKQIGKFKFVQQLKLILRNELELLSIPKRWRFIRKIPVDAQAKVNKNLIKSMFTEMKLPIATLIANTETSVNLELDFLEEILYFKGHFPNFPIYPGVAQLSFIEQFAQQYFNNLGYCRKLEQVKFNHIIQPYDRIKLDLVLKNSTIIYQLKQDDIEAKVIASGKLVFNQDNQC